mgnify:CR=1 FL=1
MKNSFLQELRQECGSGIWSAQILYLSIINLVSYCSGKHTVNCVKLGHMKYLFLVMMVGVLVGCGKRETPVPEQAKASTKPTVQDLEKDQPKPTFGKETPQSKAAPEATAQKPGSVLWEFETGSSISSPPVIGVDGTVYIGGSNITKFGSSGWSFNGVLYALNGKTGSKKWESKTGHIIRASPTIGPDGTVYVGSKVGSQEFNVHALDGKTGAKKWEFSNSVGGWMESACAIGKDGAIYFGVTIGLKGKVYCLDRKTGTKKWDFETGAEVKSSPVIGYDGTVYVGSLDKKIYALDGASGLKKWEFYTGNYLYSSPAIGADGTIFLGSYARKIYSLDGKTGAKKWEFKTGYPISFSSPAIGSDGIIYIGTGSTWGGRKVYALEGATGEKKWEFETGDGVESSPAIGSDGTVYIGSNDNKIYALDGATGDKKWEFVTGGSVSSSPVIGSDGTVYVGSKDKKLYAIKTDSKGPAKSPWPMFGQNAQRTGRAMK